MSRRTKASTLGASGPSALGPISEGPNVAAFAGKFSAMKLESSPPPAEVDRWEVRPGGMLVQKRDTNSDANARPPPLPIRVRVKYGATYREIRISPQASFGDLKKMLAGETGLHPEGQRLLYKDRERDSGAFLDTCGVKDRSKLVLVEDPTGQAKRSLELRRSAKMEKAAKSIHQISRDVDKLSSQVSALESLVTKGKKVAESDVVGLTEQLMNQLLKLDAVVADGEVKMQRRIQVKRVQKFVEMLDVLKVKNAEIVSWNQPEQQEQEQTKKKKKKQEPSQPQVVASTKWEPFDLLSSIPSTSAATTATTVAAAPPAAGHPSGPPPPAANLSHFSQNRKRRGAQAIKAGDSRERGRQRRRTSALQQRSGGAALRQSSIAISGSQRRRHQRGAHQARSGGNISAAHLRLAAAPSSVGDSRRSGAEVQWLF